MRTLSSALITESIPKIIEDKDETIASARYYRHTFGEPETLRGGSNDPKTIAKRLVDEGGQIPDIFMACGTEDPLLRESQSFHKYLMEIGVAHEYFETTGIHDWVFWDAYIEMAINWLSEK